MKPRLLDLPGGTVQMDEADYLRLGGRSVYIGTTGYAYYSTWRDGAITIHSFVVGPIPAGQHIDHINGDKLDNRRCNLRAVTPQINQVNRKHLNKNNKSGIRGVQPFGRRWRAQITVNRKNHHLGIFDTADEARAARQEAELRHYGELCP